ncbi:MAG TPA: hypothetical protein VI298_05215 [Geobacteraceae bacterium]
MLEAALWLYYINFPMLFFPKDIEKKYGYSPPVGVFIDTHGGAVIKRAILASDYELFVDYLTNNEEVTTLLDYYDSRPDLNEEEIASSWDTSKGELKNVIHGHCMMMAEMRVLKEIMALKKRDDLPEVDLDPEKIYCLENWRKLYKKFS